MDLQLKGKNALVCGSSQGIGFATAQGLAKLGANITLIARNEAKLQERVKELANDGSQNHQYIAADFSEPDTLKEKLDKYLSDNAAINILVNNTGGPPAGPANQAKLEEFTSAFSNHLLCNHILMQAVKPGMIESGYGRIVNVISTSVKAPLPNLGVSNTVRGAVANWSKTLANELGEFGITVNNVLPGATATQRLDAIISNKAKKLSISEEEAANKMLSEVPMKRFAKPEEVANAIVFLASPAAAYISGINIPVDGGRTPCY